MVDFLKGREVTTIDEIRGFDGPEPMWFEFAISTNLRGKKIRGLLEPLRQEAGRYLDVGCGYAGTLVAFAKAGFDVFGIDVSENLVAYSKANCLDHDLHDRVRVGDILDEKLVADLGKFDVITCLDVIEHVPDAKQTMDHMVSLLKPGGMLLLEIPNKHFLEFVGSDGHFCFFGITLLPRPLAMKYHGTFYPGYRGMRSRQRS